MKAKLLALCLTVVALVTTGGMASVRYNRGHGPGYRYNRNASRYEKYRDYRYDNRRGYPGSRYDGRR